MLLHQFGLIQYAERQSTIQYNRCAISEVKKSIKNNIDRKPIPFSLKEVFGAFVTFLAGIGLSITAFLGELFAAKLMTIRSRRNSRIPTGPSRKANEETVQTIG